MAAHPTIPARRIPRREDPARLQSMWSQRVRHVLMYFLGGVIRLAPGTGKLAIIFIGYLDTVFSLCEGPLEGFAVSPTPVPFSFWVLS